MTEEFEERLIAYLGGDEDEAFEDELFAAAAEHGPRAAIVRAHVDMRGGLVELDSLGLLDNFITREAAERLRRSTTQVVEFWDMGPSGHLRPDRPAEDADVLISRWVLGPLSDAVSIDLETYIADALIKTIVELEFDPADDSVYTCCSGALARQVFDVLAGMPERRVRFVARTADGRERVLAEYTREPPSE